MTARRLNDEVWLVGSGTDTQASTSPYDCHVFVVDGGTDAALIDCGSGLASERLLANLEQTGTASRVSRILITHYHADHAGGTARLRTETGACACASDETAWALRSGDERVTQVAAARAAGMYPADYRYPVSEVDAVLADGECFEIGALTVTTYAAPGHCDGHLCFLISGSRSTLFTGDAIFSHGRVSIQPIPDCRPYQYAVSAARLADLAVDDLLPGHLDLVLGHGGAHLRAAARAFGELAVPENIVATHTQVET